MHDLQTIIAMNNKADKPKARMTAKVTRKGIYHWTDWLKPRWIVLDMQGTDLWGQTFWTKRGAYKAFHQLQH